ncbi:MAG TPA: hypothetical protein VF597_03435 [Candidatus Saccharimonadales bacterium]
MGYEVKVLADSINIQGNRLTTLQETYPRLVHAERMTHRIHSKNSASTRAIPLATQISNLLDNPFIPEKFGINQPGMQSFKHLEGEKHDDAVQGWLTGRDRALTTTIELILGREMAADLFEYDPQREFVSGDVMQEKSGELKALLPKSTDQVDLSETSMLNVHKQLAGRGLEAYMWHTIVVTGTEWGNYLALRDHPEAQGEIATVARMGRAAMLSSTPRELRYGEWHLPYVEPDEFEDVADAIRASAARAAAVSYNRQNTKNFDSEVTRYESLRSGGHMSPLEHQATPFSNEEWHIRERMGDIGLTAARQAGFSDSHRLQLAEMTRFNGNFKGWTQHRKQIEGEDDFSKLRAN